ncbi:MAG: hypothetical protein Ct9H300mP21_02660 [Pseudomonadota bacterium]|nr:MAG: hypothetical protein Ct9H300mP21_02660 [Pseudomonadota bacterium]
MQIFLIHLQKLKSLQTAVRLIPREGLIVANGDDENEKSVLELFFAGN